MLKLKHYFFKTYGFSINIIYRMYFAITIARVIDMEEVKQVKQTHFFLLEN